MARAASPITLAMAIATSVGLTAFGILMLMSAGHAEPAARTPPGVTLISTRPVIAGSTVADRTVGQSVTQAQSVRVVRVVYPLTSAQR